MGGLGKAYAKSNYKLKNWKCPFSKTCQCSYPAQALRLLNRREKAFLIGVPPRRDIHQARISTHLKVRRGQKL